LSDSSVKIRIMDAICSMDGPSSKKSVRQATGFAWNTVGRIIDGLVQDKILIEKQGEPTHPGRPITYLELNPDNKLLVGIALGGNWWRFVLCNYSFDILHEYKILTPKWKDETKFYKAIYDFIMASLEKTGTSLKAIHCIGIASAGNIDPENGVLVSASTMGVKPGLRLPLQQEMKKLLKKPVLISISTVACAWAEYKFGEYAEIRNLISVGISIGIRAGIIIDGKPLITSPDRPAGSIGHTYIPGNKRQCVCGRKGCLEAFSGGRSLVKVAGELYGKTGWECARDIDLAAQDGDIRAKNILTRAARLDAMCIAFVVQLYRPEALVFTGGQCVEDGFFYNTFLEKLKRFLPEDVAASMRISISKIKEYGNAIGAARLAFEKYF